MELVIMQEVSGWSHRWDRYTGVGTTYWDGYGGCGFYYTWVWLLGVGVAYWEVDLQSPPK